MALTKPPFKDARSSNSSHVPCIYPPADLLDGFPKVLKFYPITADFVRSLLRGESEVDYVFAVTSEEAQLIHEPTAEERSPLILVHFHL